MSALQCQFGVVLPDGVAVPQWLHARGRIAELFGAASGGELVLDVSAPPQLLSRDNGLSDMTATELQRALGLLTNNASAGAVTSIGVILTDVFHGHPKTFGIMFDPGPGFFGLPDVDGIPREGCAIFLESIRRAREGQATQPGEPLGDAVEAESFFTTMHEMGHVFNLWHAEDTRNFMRSSAADVVAPRSDEGFIASHCDFLKLFPESAPESIYVRPGGSRFAERGPLQPTDADLDNADEGGRVRWPKIALHIELTSAEFFAFEPVELEVTARPARGVRGAVRVPDSVDPGYAGVRIFIEEPDGQRRLLRSPRRYCRTRSELTVSHEKPFHRDISLFGDADGFVFRRPGVHRVWMEIAQRGGRALVSNVVECRVLSFWDDRRRYERLAPLLSARNVAGFLYRRSGDFRSAAARRLVEAAEVLRRSEPKISREIHYALGRARHSLAHRRNLPRLEERAVYHFDRACAGSVLSKHKRRKIEGIGAAAGGR
ncbi:hypothetical protein [Prosthecobacter sp.]|uniref:hypothetical protein n=1 Tax=Prosthecobacter sp. TaxID=1965333 RepID=UPI0037846431